MHVPKTPPNLGQSFTPRWAAELLVETFGVARSDRFLEPCCGDGSFLGAVSCAAALGVEVDPAVAALARANTGRKVITGDFRTVDLEGFSPTAVLTNPPFQTGLVDTFLDRLHGLLPEGGRVGLLVSAHLGMTADRVLAWQARWSVTYQTVPRYLFSRLIQPLSFLTFVKDRRRELNGFLLYFEAADVSAMRAYARQALACSGKPAWSAVVRMALLRLGGEANLQEIYREVQPQRPSEQTWWREKVRQVLQTNPRFEKTGRGRYRARPLGVS